MASRVTQRIRQLHPVRDHQEIVRLSYACEFPWETTRALEFALFRTFAVPSIGALLDATGEFHRRPQKRYDDTAILIAEFCHHGYDSERGRQAIRTMNRIHHRYEIANEDYLYVLSTFICELPRFINRYGWRRYTAIETEANFRFWRRVGELMHIRELPSSYVEAETFNLEFERTHIRYSDASARVAASTRDLFVGWLLPAELRSIGRVALHALLDPPLLRAFGFAPAPLAVRHAVESALRARALVSRFLPHSEQSPLVQEQDWKSYPHGYVINELGPEHEVQQASHASSLH